MLDLLQFANPSLTPVDWTNPVTDDPLNDGLVAWYLADMSQWGSPTWRDLLGRHHGTLTEMDPGTDWVTARERPGGLGALVFLGGLEPQYIDIIGTWSLTDWTIYLWVKVTDTTTGDYISDFGAINEAAIIKGFQSGFYNLFGGAYPTGTAADSQIPITGAAIWDNVVWTQRGTNIKGFVNGIEHISVTRTGGDFAPGSNLQIGRTFGGGNNFGGSISEYRFWDHEKSGNEVRELYDDSRLGYPRTLNRSTWLVPAPAGEAPAGGRVMSSLVGAGGLAGIGGIAGKSGGLAS